MSEMRKQKIEFDKKISEMESENKRQQDFFVSAQKKFDDSKSELLNSNRLLSEKVVDLEKRLNQIEAKLNEQAAQFEKFTRVKEIEINCNSNLLEVGSEVELNAVVKPDIAFNDGVKWQINQEVDCTVSVESMNKKTLTLKYLLDKNVTVVASAHDESEVTATKVIKIRLTVQIPFKNDRFDGIVRYVLDSQKGIIGISASSISSNSESHQPICAILKRNVEKSSDFWFFHSKTDDSDAWLCLDFKNKKVNPTHYSLLSHPSGNFNIINWNIEGSHDGGKWVILDSQKDNRKLTGSNAEETFEMKDKPNKDEYYRYLRIHQTGKNNYGDYRMIISLIEFFGSIQ